MSGLYFLFDQFYGQICCKVLFRHIFYADGAGEMIIANIYPGAIC